MAEGPQYAEAPEVKTTLNSLLKKLKSDPQFAPFQRYAELDWSRFTFVKCVRAASVRNGMKNIAKIQNIVEPVSLLTPVRYIITIYNGNMDWDITTDLQKELALLHELVHVDLDHEFDHPEWDRKRAGRLLGHDLIDFKSMVKVFGTDWYVDAGVKPTIQVDIVKKEEAKDVQHKNVQEPALLH